MDSVCGKVSETVVSECVYECASACLCARLCVRTVSEKTAYFVLLSLYNSTPGVCAHLHTMI